MRFYHPVAQPRYSSFSDTNFHTLDSRETHLARASKETGVGKTKNGEKTQIFRPINRYTSEIGSYTED